jgi:hypothetical protein
MKLSVKKYIENGQEMYMVKCEDFILADRILLESEARAYAKLWPKNAKQQKALTKRLNTKLDKMLAKFKKQCQKEIKNRHVAALKRLALVKNRQRVPRDLHSLTSYLKKYKVLVLLTL